MAEGEPAEALCSELLGLPTDAAAAVVTRWLEKRGMSRTLTSFADEAPGTAHSKHSGGVCAAVAGPQGPMHRAPLARTLARAARHLWREAEAHGLAPGACSQERRLSAVFPRFRWRVRLRWLLPMRGAAAMRPQGWGRPRRALQPAQRARSSVTAASRRVARFGDGRRARDRLPRAALCGRRPRTLTLRRTKWRRRQRRCQYPARCSGRAAAPQRCLSSSDGLALPRTISLAGTSSRPGKLYDVEPLSAQQVPDVLLTKPDPIFHGERDERKRESCQLHDFAMMAPAHSRDTRIEMWA